MKTKQKIISEKTKYKALDIEYAQESDSHITNLHGTNIAERKDKHHKEYEQFYYEKAAGNAFTSGERKIVVDFIKERMSAGNVLEVGCGTGEMTNVLPNTIHYVGVDISKLAIDTAKKQHSQSWSSFNLLPADTHSLPFTDNTFDVVVSIYALEHFRSPKRYLSEMARILKSNGYLILLAPNLELPISLPNAIRHTSRMYKSLFICKRFIDYFKRLFGVYSFRVVHENFTDVTGKYEKPDDDLTYVVSSFEVIHFLERYYGFNIEKVSRLGIKTGIRYTIKKLITLLPAMRYYGSVLFVIMRK